MAGVKSMSAQEFKDWFDGIFLGDADPAAARSFCERTISPNYLRFMAGGDRTDFERAVQKVTTFRGTCKKWESSIKFFSQDGNKVAARMIVNMLVGEAPERKAELMVMAELDELGRIERAWELLSEYTGDETSE